MSSLALTYLIVTLFAFVTLNLTVVSLIYARSTVKNHRDVLRLRPIAHAFFVGNVILVVATLVEQVYMTAYYVLRAPYAVNVADVNAPDWLQTLAAAQYYVLYLESMAPSIMLLVICEGIRCLPEHRGIFKYVPADPRELTDDQLKEMHLYVAQVADERGIIDDNEKGG